MTFLYSWRVLLIINSVLGRVNKSSYLLVLMQHMRSRSRSSDMGPIWKEEYGPTAVRLRSTLGPTEGLNGPIHSVPMLDQQRA